MTLFFDAIYLILLAVAAPWILWRRIRTGRYKNRLREKLFGALTISPAYRQPLAWFHGVSVGEIHLLTTLVAAFRLRHPDWQVVVSSTTDSGLAEAAARFPGMVIAYPLDFSWACRTALRHLRPRVVVLAESELWPNFLAVCAQEQVPVVVVNARLSPRSLGRLMRVKSVATRLLIRPVQAFAAQDADTAARLELLHARRVVVTGSVKYDGALAERDIPKAQALRRLLLLDATARPLVLVAGSTHAPEERLILAAFAKLREETPGLMLILVPRHPDRFDEVANLVAATGLPWMRRSANTVMQPAVVLLDTIGELGAAWALADVGFVGGSLDGKRGGQSMIEPAGYGVPCVFGPAVWNFRDAARRLVAVGGAVQIRQVDELAGALARLIDDPIARENMGRAASQLVAEQQGATPRTLDVIDDVIAASQHLTVQR